MATGIIQRICYILSTILFGIMTYLTASIPGVKLAYESLGKYREYFLALDASQKLRIIQMFKYDDVFVLCFGIFLVSYAFNLRERLRKTFFVVITCALLYMVCDWIENYLSLKAISFQNFEFGGFFILQLLKWAFSLSALFICMLVDILKEKNTTKVLLYTGISVLAIFFAGISSG